MSDSESDVELPYIPGIFTDPPHVIEMYLKSVEIRATYRGKCNELKHKLWRESSRARRFQSERDRNSNEIQRLHDENLHLVNSLQDQQEMAEELEDVKRQLRDGLKRKHDDQDKELLDENKRLRESISGSGIKPNVDCCICLDHKELAKFTCLAPCGHLICTDVSFNVRVISF